MKTLLAVALSVAGVALFLFWSSTASGTGEVSEYWFSSDPEFELVHLRFSGGTTKRRLNYRLSADGMLRVEHAANEPGGEIYSSASYQLSQDELDGLIRDAVNGGLLTVSDEARQAIKDLERRYFSSDSGSVSIRFALPHVRMPGAAQAKAMHAELAMSPGAYRNSADRAPHIPELAAVEALITSLRTLGKNAKEVQQ